LSTPSYYCFQCAVFKTELVMLNKSTPAFAAATSEFGHGFFSGPYVLDLAPVNPSHLRGVSALWHQRDLLLSAEEHHVDILFMSSAASMASSVYSLF
jgi:hypothetical protein